MDKDKIKGIWSCKLNQPETLTKHRTYNAAKKKVGDYGLVYLPDTDSVHQVFKMSNNTLKGFDVDTQYDQCTIFDFDMRETILTSPKYKG